MVSIVPPRRLRSPGWGHLRDYVAEDYYDYEYEIRSANGDLIRHRDRKLEFVERADKAYYSGDIVDYRWDGNDVLEYKERNGRVTTMRFDGARGWVVDNRYGGSGSNSTITYKNDYNYTYTTAATTSTTKVQPPKPKTAIDWLNEQVESVCKLARA